ncbi:hypothetical protein NIZ92_10010 [Alcaligenes sp. 1735tsa3]|uniref:hypothetical protein n=1 Tax=Alcaligenes sp. 1735tsa3 TaxID=2953809 RepID=UPI0020A6E9D0|nr:hypothetical protein [Alcaligenes sp. 1735tsa3]USY23667.1 hypothetical protein NIZ92_10010 [Alcaligenes sp. 1735tsa3]
MWVLKKIAFGNKQPFNHRSWCYYQQSLISMISTYPPCLLPPEDYAQVFVHAGNYARGYLTKLELLIHLDVGKILYKAIDNQKVAIKVTWPDDLPNPLSPV